MKKLLTILTHIESKKLSYNIINEYEQLRVEIIKNDKYINWFTIDEDSIHLGVGIECGCVEVEVGALLNYITQQSR